MSLSYYLTLKTPESLSSLEAYMIVKSRAGVSNLFQTFLVSGCDLPCQQEISLVMTKAPPIHY